jgi:hypothetical protein
MNAANEGQQHRAPRPAAPADLQTEVSAEDRSETVGSTPTSPRDRQPYSC